MQLAQLPLFMVGHVWLACNWQRLHFGPPMSCRLDQASDNAYAKHAVAALYPIAGGALGGMKVRGRLGLAWSTQFLHYWGNTNSFALCYNGAPHVV